ncbi:MAG: hypothetical protein SP1CHLAM54_07800 [Chlamydiia bacterium]|nr:hypothetical protein [Chlamydiia bacterium]MCH9615686.1 hypothetical protein [Chlamydiia bacterium]MCH9628911.1 hypothetical protein [Chlamydiia bacterium]
MADTTIQLIDTTAPVVAELPQERREFTYRETTYVMAGLALLGAAAAAIAGAAFPATGLVLIGGAIAYHGYSTFDINNPSDLLILKNQVSQMTLTDAVAQHGWEKIERYELLTPVQIAEKFENETRYASGSEILAKYSERDFEQFGKLDLYSADQVKDLILLKRDLARFTSIIESQIALVSTDVRAVELERDRFAFERGINTNYQQILKG